MKLRWEKTGREVKSNGESTTTYTTTDGRLRIESRKRAIPHANDYPGYWFHTSFFLISDEGEKEFMSLTDAKAAAEECHEVQN